MDNLSVADALALMKSNEAEGFGSGNGWWIILLFLFFLGFSGRGFGGLFGGGTEQIQLTQLERDVLNGNANTQKEILESRYTTQLGFQNIAAQMASCCCDLKTAIHSEGEATRALITENTIQELRERLAIAATAGNNQALASEIINAVRPMPVPSWPVSSPYASSYPYCYYNATNI